MAKKSKNVVNVTPPKLEKVPPLTGWKHFVKPPTIVNDGVKYVAEVNLDPLVHRVNYILRFIAQTYGFTIDWWDWTDTSDRDYDPIDFEDGNYVDEHSVRFYCATNHFHELPELLTKNNEEWGLDDEFPTRWLTEDFEEELVTGIEKLKLKRYQAIIEYNERVANKKVKEKEILDSALAKLDAANLSVAELAQLKDHFKKK
jgi:hypothetical protein